MKTDVFRITGRESDCFTVERGGETLAVRARGKLKRGDAPMVGDFVRLDRADVPVIAEVLPRKNSMLRPPVANIDMMVIVVAPRPEIDYYLVDKMIVNCHRAGIECMICLNKSDISGGEERDLAAQYGGEVSAVAAVSALGGKMDDLLSHIRGKLVCFCGQSAVGKSTISNGILGFRARQTGEISERLGRGKNTTTTAAILRSPDGFEFVDTPGFSMLDISGVPADEIASYYGEFVARADECRFHPCTHIAEPDCAVRAAAARGEIDPRRYERYKRIYEEKKLAEKRNRRYK